MVATGKSTNMYELAEAVQWRDTKRMSTNSPAEPNTTRYPTAHRASAERGRTQGSRATAEHASKRRVPTDIPTAFVIAG